MTFTELAMLARVAKTLKPRTIFEMGTYNGLSTAMFLLNTASNAQIFTLDLPPDAAEGRAPIPGDKELIGSRHLASVPKALGLNGYIQLLCDSLDFDPSPYLDSVDLGLIDAAHDLRHVHNDTVKMSRMMSDSGIVFWHDYGGKGVLRPLATYLEKLATRCPLYRIPGTTLAWGPARELKGAIAQHEY
jgi:hypothetical protein